MALAVLLLAGFLASCSGGGQKPFSKSTAPAGRTAPAIVLQAMNGVPEDKAQVLFDALVSAAAPRDIAIVKGEFAGSYTLSGEFRATQGAGGVELSYRWTLLSDKGQLLHTIASTEVGRPVAGDPWSGVDPDLLRRVAAYTTESLSTRLAQLGFATQGAGLPPPLENYAEAGPGAEKDIDVDLYGRTAAAAVLQVPEPAAVTSSVGQTNNLTPSTETEEARPIGPFPPPIETVAEPDPDAPVPTLTQVLEPPVQVYPPKRKANRLFAGEKGDKQELRIAAREPEAEPSGPETTQIPEAVQDLLPETVPEVPKPKEERKERKAAAKQEISAVAVTGVSGARGRGNDELTAAMRRALKQAGWPVYNSPRPDALTIEGKVGIAKPSGKTQKVVLEWVVKAPGGKVLGAVKQANEVPAGSLDRSWGKAAEEAVQGAAEGIFGLVGKLQKRS